MQGREVGDSNDGVAALGGAAGLLGEARAIFGRRIIASHDEEIVKGRNHAPGATAARKVDTLVECVKKIARRRAPQQRPRSVPGQRFAKRPQKSVGAIAEAKPRFRMGARETEKNFA